MVDGGVRAEPVGQSRADDGAAACLRRVLVYRLCRLVARRRDGTPTTSSRSSRTGLDPLDHLPLSCPCTVFVLAAHAVRGDPVATAFVVADPVAAGLVRPDAVAYVRRRSLSAVHRCRVRSSVHGRELV
jgi:hypothetical protein